MDIKHKIGVFMNNVLKSNTQQPAAIADYGLVSVIMPNYNSARFIKATVESVVAQTYTNWELIIVDDCSTDHSPDMIRQLADDRIRVVESTSNGGAAAARNKAIELARGRWIAFLDSDDLWNENKLLRHLGFMVEKQADFSFTHYAVLNDNDEEITVFSPGEDVYGYSDILKHCSIGCSTVIYDSESLGKVYMPTEAVKREDFACWLEILRLGKKAVCFHECLTKYRLHSNSVSSNKAKMIKYQWNVYRKVEGLSLFRSAYYMLHWAFWGFLKYRR